MSAYAQNYPPAVVPLGIDPSGVPTPLGISASGGLKTGMVAIPGLDIPTHDYVGCSYTGSDLTGVVYKTGGSGGTTVATLTLAYTDGKLTSVTKS